MPDTKPATVTPWPSYSARCGAHGVTPQAIYANEIGELRGPTALLPVLSRTLGVPWGRHWTYARAKGALNSVSPAQRRHVDELRKRDRLAVVRITAAVARFER